MSEAPARPLIVAFVTDLLFTSKISNVTSHLGYDVRWVESGAEVGQPGNAADAERPGERLHGREGALFALVTEWQPALLLFDLSNEAIPWQRWIPILKSSPATRRIPVMAFGSHADVAVMKEARRVGADFVLARSRFTQDMAHLFQKHARVPEHAAIREACAAPLAALAAQGIAKFNRGEYYACHDDLEEAWRADESAGRDLYQGILQVGIAYYQIERGNFRGAMKMLLRLRQWLEPMPDTCRGVDVQRLREDVAAVYAALAALGPEKIADFDRRLFRPIVVLGRSPTTPGGN